MVVTVSKSLVVFLFFLLTTPLAAAYYGIFQKYYEESVNTEFRKEMEETSAKGYGNG